MAVTTQDQRDYVKGLADQVANDNVPLSRRLAYGLALDADRLAKLEDGIRDLADAANAEAESCRDSSEGDSGYETADTLDGYARLMRALLDGE